MSTPEAMRKQIRREAQDILKKFSASLESVSFREKPLGDKGGGYRREGNGASTDERFKEIMFENAPNKQEDVILAEKKSW